MTSAVNTIEQPKTPKDLRTAVICLSGGMDSATLLWYAVEHLHLNKIACISFNYGQNHKTKELEAADKVWTLFAGQYRDVATERSVIDMPLRSIIPLHKTALLDGDIPLKESAYTPQVVVPGRNILFVAYATAYATAIEYYYVMFGPCKDDYNVFPDCREDYVRALDGATKLGYGVKVDAPFVGMSKHQIIKWGLAHQVPYKFTWSCYVGKDTPCHQCSACVERESAFAARGVEDPLLVTQ